MTWNWQQPDWRHWRYDSKALSELEQRFLLGAGRLLGAWQHLNPRDQDALKVDLLSDEAMKTSQIEGEFLNRTSVQSSIRREFGLTPLKKSGAAEQGIAELMVSVFKGFDQPLTHQDLFAWHDMVCRTQRNMDVIGGYRTHEEAMQVVSGPIDKPQIHFEAPPSIQVPEEMDTFLSWLENARLPILTLSGIAHLYFVSIHPFEDGNGRIARAISEHCISRALGQPSLLALSRQIEKERKSYYRELEHHNKRMDIQSWLVWFAETALSAQEYSLQLIDHIIIKTQMLDSLRGQLNKRQERALIRMFDAGPAGFIGGLSAKNYRAITGASTPTTTRDLNDLVDKGALRKTGERKGTRYWLNT